MATTTKGPIVAKATVKTNTTTTDTQRPERVAQGTLAELQATGRAIDPATGRQLTVDDPAKATPADVRFV